MLSIHPRAFALRSPLISLCSLVSLCMMLIYHADCPMLMLLFLVACWFSYAYVNVFSPMLTGMICSCWCAYEHVDGMMPMLMFAPYLLPGNALADIVVSMLMFLCPITVSLFMHMRMLLCTCGCSCAHAGVLMIMLVFLCPIMVMFCSCSSCYGHGWGFFAYADVVRPIRMFLFPIVLAVMSMLMLCPTMIVFGPVYDVCYASL